MSFDFLRVSSILQALKSAAAAASCVVSKQADRISNFLAPYSVVIFAIRVDEAELVIVHSGSVVRSHGPETFVSLII